MAPAMESGDRFEFDSAEIEMDAPLRPPPGREEPQEEQVEAPEPLEDLAESVDLPPIPAGEPPARERDVHEVPPEPVRRRRRRETLSRVLWAVPWIVFAILIIAAGGLTFTVALIGLGVIGLREFFRMTEAWRPLAPAAYLMLGAMLLGAHYGDQFQVLLFLVLGFPVMFIIASRRVDREGITTSVALTIFATAWIALPLVHTVLLRDLPLHGAGLLVDVLVATFIADTAAYAAGRMFGNRRITPRLSPNKTFEGLLGGFVGGTLGFWFAGLYQDWLSGVDALAMGAAVALLAPMGDLFASMVKRDLGVKDTGRMFGPHGGLVDRLDAAFFTIVAGYYLSLVLVY